MKSQILILSLLISAVGAAQAPCSSTDIKAAADRVHSLQKRLAAIQVREMDATVSPPASAGLAQLKDALSSFADLALACAPLSASPVELQTQFAQLLDANLREPNQNSAAREAVGSYGRELSVQVNRPSNIPEILDVEFSFDIECGNDHLLLLYAPAAQGWEEQIRWQAAPFKKVSDAFGDFFVYAVLPPSARNKQLRLVVAHGKPWCTSRFSGFDLDVLSSGPVAKSPNLLWHTERSYSRGDFEPTLKSVGETFELRVDSIPMDGDEYVRRVIYRYLIDDKQQVHRIEPIAVNARGFVEEWLSAPWSESVGFLAPDAAPDLEPIHEQFQSEAQMSGDEFVTHSYGPVRACRAAGTFQIQINSTRNKIVLGKPGGDSVSQPTHYFHVREVKDGYQILSAPTAPDSACTGGDLMPKTQ